MINNLRHFPKNTPAPAPTVKSATSHGDYAPCPRFLLQIAFLAVLAFCLAATAQVTQAAGRVFVVNTGSANVSAVDADSGAVLATIQVGARPIRIVANQAGTRAYVSNFGGSSVSVIDTVNLSMVATIDVPSLPQESAITRDGTRLFVVHHPLQIVSVLDLATNTLLRTVPIGDQNGAPGKTATDIAFTPDGRYAFVPNYSQNVLNSIDSSTYAVTAIPTGGQPRRVAITPDGNRAFVANFTGDSATAIDVRTLSTVATTPTGNASRGVAANPNPQRHEVYVTNVKDGTISVISTDTFAVLAEIKIGRKPWNILFNSSGSLAVASNSGSDTISIIDTATRAVTRTIPVGDGPFFSVYNNNESRLYVCNSGPPKTFEQGSLSIIDTSTYTVIASPQLGLQPFTAVYVNP
ncbi:hypothetical protein BH20VER3_BH20VER3_02830 [soil metagenome]